MSSPGAAPLADLDGRVARALRNATAAAAASVVPLVGSGDGMAVDGTAVDALRAALAAIAVDGRVVAGEGEKDAAPMLAPGERFGTGGLALDLAVDPVDGTRLAASGRDGAMAVLAVTGRDGFADLGPAHYLAKQVTWLPDAAGLPIDRLVARLAEVRGAAPADVRVAVQDRPRNADVAARARAAGATVVPFEHGDIERSLRAAQPGTDLDVVTGIGGAPEGLLTAAAVRALGADMVASYAPQSAGEAERLVASGRSDSTPLTLDDLCPGPAWLFLSAVTACRPGADGVLEAARREARGIRVASWDVGPERAPRRSELLVGDDGAVAGAGR
ncbi:fructose-bisphosphatase class II [Agromyces mariniharenae]|uniref:Fructose-1,6-bisphosphatase class 2 n=1 Tax=Agromyces mariniharenae TaxID=2604423 RepID=A0A5S4UTP3_9MICO|nr:fructose-bisphosphatase class II [Agromyces mariniharenae]TYL50317.1 fructose-bisphosphatase class II family protein [Agromyces mariniharenae]